MIAYCNDSLRSSYHPPFIRAIWRSKSGNPQPRYDNTPFVTISVKSLGDQNDPRKRIGQKANHMKVSYTPTILCFMRCSFSDNLFGKCSLYNSPYRCLCSYLDKVSISRWTVFGTSCGGFLANAIGWENEISWTLTRRSGETPGTKTAGKHRRTQKGSRRAEDRSNGYSVRPLRQWQKSLKEWCWSSQSARLWWRKSYFP